MSSDEELPLTLTPLTPLEEPKVEHGTIRVLPFARLVSHQNFLMSVDLIHDFSLGRAERCSVAITPSICSERFAGHISKVHFEIKRSTDEGIIYIEDLSKNGTFVNGTLVGRGKRRILESNDKISVNGTLAVLYTFFKQNVINEDDNFLPKSLKNKYEVVKLLGRGACGEVRLIRDRSTFKKYAMKKILLSEDLSDLCHRMNHPKRVENEIEILQRLQHPCILNIEGFEMYNPDAYYITLEYMQGGDLTKRIQKNPMPERVAKFYFVQMVLACRYLHSKGVIHRDLKPDNMLLLSDKLETLLKIGDFGLSKVVSQSHAKTVCGTLKYLAPEVFRATSDHQEYTNAVDVWSLGVVLYQMITTRFPFQGNTDSQLARNIVKGQFSLSGIEWKYADELKDLITKMLHVSPHERVSLKEVYRHPWITEDDEVRDDLEEMFDDMDIDINLRRVGPRLKRGPRKRRSKPIINDSDSSSP